MIFKNKMMFHPGKCAGTSIETMLVLKHLHKQFSELESNVMTANYDLLYGKDKELGLYLHHCDIKFVQQYTDYDVADFETFTFVRNPYDRLLSAYYYNNFDKNFTFNQFVQKRFEQLNAMNTTYTVNHFGLMSAYTHYKTYTVDFIGKVETLQEDMKKLGYEMNSKRKAKATQASSKYGSNYLSAYDDKSIEIVNSVLHDDFVKLNYPKV